MKNLIIKTKNNVTTVTLNRPEVHNAFNESLIEELEMAFQNFVSDKKIRVVILTGSGKSFCAGADLNYMKSASQKTEKQNIRESLRMQRMFDTINSIPQPLIGLINGTAIGGGMGLLSVCDVGLAHEKARFGFSEVKLGIAPSIVSPFVIQKIGLSQARRLFLTGEKFGVDLAKSIGLVHEIYNDQNRQEKLDFFVKEFLTSGPFAMKAIKRLFCEYANCKQTDIKRYTVEQISKLRAAEEAQERIKNFLCPKKNPSTS